MRPVFDAILLSKRIIEASTAQPSGKVRKMSDQEYSMFKPVGSVNEQPGRYPNQVFCLRCMKARGKRNIMAHIEKCLGVTRMSPRIFKS